MQPIRYCFTIDLKDDDRLVSDFIRNYKQGVVLTEAVENMQPSHMLEMGIYAVDNRLMLLLEVNEAFDIEKDFKTIRMLPEKNEGSELLSTFQQQMRLAKPDEQCALMQQIYNLNS